MRAAANFLPISDCTDIAKSTAKQGDTALEARNCRRSTRIIAARHLAAVARVGVLGASRLINGVCHLKCAYFIGSVNFSVNLKF